MVISQTTTNSFTKVKDYTRYTCTCSYTALSSELVA